jgi:hypothetical protein
LNRQCICIEHEEEFCELGALRLEQEVFDFREKDENRH